MSNDSHAAGERLPANAFAQAVRARELTAIDHLFAEDVEMHTPIISEPIVGRDNVAPIFAVLNEIFEDIEIVEEQDVGDRFLLSFKTTVGGEPLQIVDLLSLNSQGEITEFVVAGRPLAGLQAFSDAVAAAMS